MVRKLDELGLVTHVPYKGVQLTPAGQRVALEVMRHHRLLELYLAEHLGVPWDRVHEEAEALEHHRSEEHTSELQSRQYLVCRLLLENQHVLHIPQIAR